MITVRNPNFDFSKTTPNWARSKEFAHMFNATSMLFPPLERFLNRSMLKARQQLKTDDPDSVRLKEDIDLFMRQEGVHFAIHTSFNEMLVRHGFDKLPEFEAQMEEEYREFLKHKSLRFLTGYCEGFEILGPIYARIWLDEIADMFEGGDANAVAMFRWHISEEFEHRTVCFDVYHKLFGNYFYRIWAMHHSLKHQAAYIMRVLDYLLSKERSSMSEAEVKASQDRMKALGHRIQFLALKKLLRVYMPWYSPRKAPTPRNLTSTISNIEAHYLAKAS